MRGKRTSITEGYPTVRIIPAHAGQTEPRQAHEWTSSDHPRACGANAVMQRVSDDEYGSSPRMRGKHAADPAGDLAPRIIPAHAGQTFRHVMATSVSTDHPRACGANDTADTLKPESTGSSPRMRGKRGLGCRGHGFLRIIPAHAGQTSTSCRTITAVSDHPRACGANVCCVVA